MRTKKSSPSVERIGIFDIGSHSVKLMIADKRSGLDPYVLVEKSSGTRLGEGIHQDFVLSKAAIKRTLKTLEEFKSKGDFFGVHRWVAIATSAVRDAKNGFEFKDQFYERMGFKIRVLSGQKEAALIFRGVTSDPNLTKSTNSLLVMDVGGGSGEWILGKGSKIQRSISLDLGCVRMTERFLRGDPYSIDSYEALMAHYQKWMIHLQKRFGSHPGIRMIGTGGSISTAAALHFAKKFPRDSSLHGYVLEIDDLQRLLHSLKSMTHTDRMKLKYLPKKRADIIVAGMALFVMVMQVFEVKQIQVSLCGLRYGILLES